jgi:hypothetical protein
VTQKAASFESSMSQPIESVSSSLFSSSPTDILYHYTSLDALVSIVPGGKLWASDVHYLNDSSELHHAVQLFVRDVHTRQQSDPPSSDVALLWQLSSWLQGRLASGHLLFVACFTEAGDLLSQWRGYTPHARGVSLGFSSSHLLECANVQGFAFGRCIYQQSEQQRIAHAAMQAVIDSAKAVGPAPPSEAHPSQSFHPVFTAAEPHLLMIAALLKHQAFEAEKEWRAVSAYVSDYVNSPVHHRAGRTTLVPYWQFDLHRPGMDGIGIESAVLGPTPHPALALQALDQFLAHNKVSGGKMRRTSVSQVPYRET